MHKTKIQFIISFTINIQIIHYIKVQHNTRSKLTYKLIVKNEQNLVLIHSQNNTNINTE